MIPTDNNSEEQPADGADAGETTRYVGVRVPQDLHEWLVGLAKRERRSLNAQVVVLLERAHDQVDRDATTRNGSRPKMDEQDAKG